MGQSIFSGIRFSELLKFDPQEAFEYRLKTNGTKIPETYGLAPLNTSMNDLYGDNGELLEEKTEELDGSEDTNIGSEPNALAPKEEIPEVVASTEGPLEVVIGGKVEVSGDITTEDATMKTEYSREDFKKLLDDKGVTYFKGATDEKLAELCIENNLL